VTVDLRTTYLGLDLSCPVVPSASPIGRDLELQRLLHQGAGTFVEATSYFPEVGEYRTGATPYLRHLEAAVAALDLPVIASLNGTSPGGWTRYARAQQDAGAAAIELNPYVVAASPDDTAASVEEKLIALVAQVCNEVTVPVAVKLSPSYSALAHLAAQLVDAGAAGLVLFNRFLQPDVDLDALEVVDEAHLSHPGELLLPLRWCALLRPQLDVSLALTSGVHDGEAAAKAVLVGADVAMAASALLRHGPEHVTALRDGLERVLGDHGYTSVAQARGALSAANAPDPDAFERAHYIQALTRYRTDGL
jgi:dihydroorotate dehydrogenase (fumarate)